MYHRPYYKIVVNGMPITQRRDEMEVSVWFYSVSALVKYYLIADRE